MGWLMSLIPQLFLRDMLHSLGANSSHTHPISTKYYSPLLHCSILALATANADNPLIKQRTTRAKIASYAKNLLDRELSRPSLSLVQALVIISEYHCGLGEREHGYMYMGKAIFFLHASPC